ALPIYLIPLVLDQLLEAVDHVQVAALVDPADVPGAQPTVGRDHLRGRLGLVEVALHHLRTPHPDLACVGGGPPFRRAGRSPSPRRPPALDDPALGVGMQQADRARRRRALVLGMHVAARAELREAVALLDQAAETLPDLVRQR